MAEKRKCYVNAPWGVKGGFDFDRNYRQVLKPAVEKAGLSCWRGDDPLPSQNMQKAILSAALHHDVMIADLTIGSPNVTYEIGVRHALGQGDLILLGDVSQLPIHFRNLPIIHYEIARVSQSQADADALGTAIIEQLNNAENISQDNPVRGITGPLIEYVEARRLKNLGTRVFIGHGRSALWRELQDFIQGNLKLSWDEFNRVSIAGITNTARLSQMLNDASFAFLVMTAEDELQDGKMHARLNVVHEAGLFQGHLDFSRAIILLEEGCEEFSNSHGLGQIRFPKGNIKAAFEQVRQVLEREGLV
jgi:hypothetical protein